jgi:hypothetical protein
MRRSAIGGRITYSGSHKSFRVLIFRGRVFRLTKTNTYLHMHDRTEASHLQLNIVVPTKDNLQHPADFDPLNRGKTQLEK